MKHLVTLIVAVALFSTGAWAQCTPNAATGSPGLTPETDSLPCVEVGVPYDEVVYLENFDNFTATVPVIGQVTVTVDSLRIDSITNAPCGLSYLTNKPSATYYAGETGCIAITGTSTENVGQYRLNIYVHVWATVPFLGSQDFQGEASDVVSQVENLTGQPLGVDFNYFLRVKNPSDPCPNIDRVNPSANLTAALVCPTTNFTATANGTTEVCDGETTNISLTFTNGVSPYNILWSSGNTSDNVSLGEGSYTVTVVDANNDTATTSVTIVELPLPTAGFTAVNTVGTGEATTTNTSTDATSYQWDFDGTTYTDANPTHDFGNNGDYDVTLIATNDCGSDTLTQTVTITGVVGISELGSMFSSVQISPNPSSGNFNLKVVANQTSPVNVKVFNLQGQVVYTSVLNTVAGQASTQSIQLGNSASGVYIIQVQGNDALITEKLIVR